MSPGSHGKTAKKWVVHLAVASAAAAPPGAGKTRLKGKGHPTTADMEYSAREIEFMFAIEDFKRVTRRQFPTLCEAILVVRYATARQPMHTTSQCHRRRMTSNNVRSKTAREKSAMRPKSDDAQMMLPPWQGSPEERIVSADQSKVTKPTTALRAQKALVTDARGVAEMLLCDLATVWRLQEEGRLPAPILVGGEERWRNAEIRRWVREGCPDRRTWERRFCSR